MYPVPLRVPRVFYVNSVLPPDAPESPGGALLGGVRVRRTLPFGREPLHLYQARPHAFKGLMFSPEGLLSAKRRTRAAHAALWARAAAPVPGALACVPGFDVFSPKGAFAAGRRARAAHAAL